MAIRFVPGGGQSYLPPSQQKSPIRSRGSGRSSRGGGGGGGSPAPSYKDVKIDGNTVFINGQGFSVKPENQATFIRQQTGGSGSSAKSALAQAKATLKRIEEQRRAEEEARRIQEAQAKAEQQRIENLRRAILEKGAQERERISRNAANERIRTTTTEIRKIENGKSTNALVWKYENLDTGEVKYRSYEKPKGGGGRRLSGGVDMQVQSPKQVQEIKSELTSAGLTPVVRNGQVVGFSSPDTKQSYAYTEEGLEAYNKKIEALASRERTTERPGRIASLAMAGDSAIGKGVTAVKNTVSNLLRRSGINVKDSRVANYVSKVAVQLKNRGLDNVKKYRTYVENRRDEALRNMRSTKPNLKQPKTLTQVNKWIRSFDRYVSNRAILTALDIGVATPQLVNQLRQSPLATIAVLPGAIKDGFVQDFRTIKSGDLLGITNLATDYLVYTATFGLASEGVKATTRGIMKLLPGTKTLKAGQIVVRKAGKTKPALVLKSQTVKSGSKPLSAQARFAGKKVTAVTAQAEQLTSLLRRKKIIRKPIPGEANFPAQVKKTLAKFDAGKKLTNKEFADVNKWLRKNVADNITLLERSLYLDPAKGLRVSRLGIQAPKTAGLRDILRGNFKLWQRQGRPQILVFENAKIAKFPKALRTIERKLKAGQTLTTAETNRLIRWQVQTGSGRFKPIGSTIYAGGRELEITLAPGELIRRVKSLGRVYLDGRKVTIVSAEVFKPSKVILKQMKLAHLGKLSKSAVNKLNNFLSKKLGRRVRVETPDVAKSFARKAGRMARRADPNIPVLRVRGSGIMVLRSGMRGLVTRPSLRTPVRGGRVTRRAVRGGRVVGRKATRPTGRPVRGGRVTRTPVKRTPARRTVAKRTAKPVRPVRRVGRMGRGGKSGTIKKPIPRIAERFKPKQLSKKVQTYYVVEKVRGKMKKLYPKPLTLKDARDYATYSIDNRLSKTAFFVPLGKAKRVVSPPKAIQGYYSSNAKKFRPYKIRMGKKKALVNGYIEKRKYFQDTKGERLQARRLRAMSSKKSVRRTARKITPTQRRVLLARLKKARAVRMRNLRRRR